MSATQLTVTVLATATLVCTSALAAPPTQLKMMDAKIIPGKSAVIPQLTGPVVGPMKMVPGFKPLGPGKVVPGPKKVVPGPLKPIPNLPLIPPNFPSNPPPTPTVPAPQPLLPLAPNFPNFNPHPEIMPIAPTPGTWLPATPANKWYFGMSVQLHPTQYGRGLLVASVTHQSPASRAGLEPGDIILSAGPYTMGQAYSNHGAIQLLQQSVSHYGGQPVPTSANVPRIAPTVVPTQGVAQLQVLNVQNGQVVLLTVYPQRTGNVPTPITTAMAY